MRLDHITPKQSALTAEGVDGEVDRKPKICESYKPLSRIQGIAPYREIPTELLDDHRALEPPDPIPNSVVKRRIADGSVVLHHVRVGHRQAPIRNPRSLTRSGVSSLRGRKSGAGSAAWRGNLQDVIAGKPAPTGAESYNLAGHGRSHGKWLG